MSTALASAAGLPSNYGMKDRHMVPNMHGDHSNFHPHEARENFSNNDSNSDTSQTGESDDDDDDNSGDDNDNEDDDDDDDASTAAGDDHFPTFSEPLKARHAVSVPAGALSENTHALQMDVDNVPSPKSNQASKKTQPNADGLLSQLSDYAQSDAGSSDSSGTSIESLDLENDDDYDGVDNVSAASDDSREFEKEVEESLRAEENDIDWDDHATYSYSSNWATGEYDLHHDLNIMEPMTDFAMSYLNTDDRLTQSAPELSAGQSGGATINDTGDYPFSWTDGNSSRSSTSNRDTPSTTSDTPNELERVPSTTKDSRYEESDTEGDEDDPRGTVSDPGTILSHSNSAPHPRKLAIVPEPSFCPPENLPPLRRVKLNPKKTSAYTVNGPSGRRIRFIPPRMRRANRWIVISTPIKPQSSADTGTETRSISDSGASSPTMINIDEAKINGNTRTGAVITDHVYGAIFRSENCRPESSSSRDAAPLSSFYRNLVVQSSEIVDPFHDDELLFDDELIDFEQCDEPSTFATPAASIQSPMAETPLPGTKGKTRDVDMMSMNARALFTDEATPIGAGAAGATSSAAFPMTPFSNQMGDMELNSSTSPRKRRLDDNPIDHIVSSSPSCKKSRLEGTSDAVMTE